MCRSRMCRSTIYESIFSAFGIQLLNFVVVGVLVLPLILFTKVVNADNGVMNRAVGLLADQAPSQSANKQGAKSFGLDWHKTNIQLLRGSDFKVGQRSRSTVTLEHANGWRYGDTFGFFDWVQQFHLLQRFKN